MINIDIKNTVQAIQDPNEKLQFIQGIVDCCNRLATQIHVRYQVPFAEIVTEEPTTEENTDAICE